MAYPVFACFQHLVIVPSSAIDPLYPSVDLFYLLNNPILVILLWKIDFPGGWLVASEPFGETGTWMPVPNEHAVIFSFGSSPEQIIL